MQTDDHLQCFTGACTPGYHALPETSYRQIESRLTRAAQFVGAVVAPFVLDDFKQFFVSPSVDPDSPSRFRSASPPLLHGSATWLIRYL